MHSSSFEAPSELHYLIEHQVWAHYCPETSKARIGITALGVKLSGEIYMCRPKRVGIRVEQNATVAVVELAKSIVAVKSPVSGTIHKINEQLEDQPWLVHQDPYGAGWIAILNCNESEWSKDQANLLHDEAEVQKAMQHHAWLYQQAQEQDPRGIV